MDYPGRKIWIADREKLLDLFVRTWGSLSQEAIGARGRFTAALSGGKTPVPFYQRVAEFPDSFPWGKTHIFLVDERWVPPDHPDSNYRLVQENLLSRAAIPPENIHPIPVSEGSPESAAHRYEETLKKFFQLSAPGEFPELDLIVLGMGEDGHIASLFPGHPALLENQNLAIAVRRDGITPDRITLTLPVINRGKHILWVVTGKEKAAVLKRILEDKERTLPASRVVPGRGNFVFLLDQEAGAQLSW